jgi:hypothetical protein
MDKLTSLLEGGGEVVMSAVEGISFPLEREKLSKIELLGLSLEPKLLKLQELACWNLS